MVDASVWMRLALEQAAGAERVSPNPAVGCVLVRDAVVVGMGATRPPGGPHAERVALAAAGVRARGATAYVTLEPCSHWGRTPPCVDGLIDAGVARVVCATIDPDPNVQGKGVSRLRAAGIAVEIGDGEEAARRSLLGFFRHRLSGRPLVTAKFAVSLDGRIATRTGDARWISGAEARARTVGERAMLDAILVGAGTAGADDPSLTARKADGSLAATQPLRVVLDSRGRLPLAARLLDGVAPTLVATTEAAPAAWCDAIRATGAALAVLPAGDGGVALGALLDHLGGRGVLTLLVEGGAVVHGAFFDAGLVDRVQAVVAPVVVGGVAAPGAVGGRGVERMAEAYRLRDVTVDRVGEDVIITGLTRPLEELTGPLGMELSAE